jgi:hypothetical protein
MKKALVWIIILVLLVAGYFVRQQYGNVTTPDVTIEEEIENDMNEDEEVENTNNGTIQPNDGGETGVDPAFIEQIEAQASAGVDIEGEELTDEDIKLIEDILQQITDSVQQ